MPTILKEKLVPEGRVTLEHDDWSMRFSVVLVRRAPDGGWSEKTLYESSSSEDALRVYDWETGDPPREAPACLDSWLLKRCGLIE